MHLKEVNFDIDDSLEMIGSQAFFNCEVLEKVVLPKNFKSFGEGVFFRCIKLKELYIYNTTPPTWETGLASYHLSSGQISYSDFSSDFTVYVPSKAVEVYKNSIWSSYNIQPINLKWDPRVCLS